MDGQVTKVDQLKLLIEATRMLSSSNICPESPRDFRHWWALVKHSHLHGFLYVGFEQGKLSLVTVGYRVKDISKNLGDVLPDNEEGDILYVPLLVSKSMDKFQVLKMLHFYLKDNPNVREVAYHDRGTNHIKHFMLRRNHVQVKES